MREDAGEVVRVSMTVNLGNVDDCGSTFHYPTMMLMPVGNVRSRFRFGD